MPYKLRQAGGGNGEFEGSEVILFKGEGDFNPHHGLAYDLIIQVNLSFSEDVPGEFREAEWPYYSIYTTNTEPLPIDDWPGFKSLIIDDSGFEPKPLRYSFDGRYKLNVDQVVIDESEKQSPGNNVPQQVDWVKLEYVNFWLFQGGLKEHGAYDFLRKKEDAEPGSTGRFLENFAVNRGLNCLDKEGCDGVSAGYRGESYYFLFHLSESDKNKVLAGGKSYNIYEEYWEESEADKRGKEIEKAIEDFEDIDNFPSVHNQVIGKETS